MLKNSKQIHFLIILIALFSIVLGKAVAQNQIAFPTVVTDYAKRKFKGELYFIDRQTLVLKSHGGNEFVSFPMDSVRLLKVGNEMRFLTYYGLLCGLISYSAYASMIHQEYVSGGDFYFQPMFAGLSMVYLAPFPAKLFSKNYPNISYKPKKYKEKKLIRIQQIMQTTKLENELLIPFLQISPKAFNKKRTSFKFSAGLNSFWYFNLNQKNIATYFLPLNLVEIEEKQRNYLPVEASFNLKLNDNWQIGLNAATQEYNKSAISTAYYGVFNFRRATAEVFGSYRLFEKSLNRNVDLSGNAFAGISLNYIGSHLIISDRNKRTEEGLYSEFYLRDAKFKPGVLAGSELNLLFYKRYGLIAGAKFHFFQSYKVNPMTYTNEGEIASVAFSKKHFLIFELLPYIGFKYFY